MTSALSTAVSALKSHSERLDVTADDIANVDTTGFKSSKASFSSSFQQTVRAPTANQPVGVQVGLGNQISAVSQNFSQGAFQRTGIATDLALSGEGFMVVNSGAGGTGANFFTRNGSFAVDKDGYVIDSQGNRLQVVTAKWNAATNPPTLVTAADDPSIVPNAGTGVPQANTVGDLMIPSSFTTGGTTETVVNYSIDTNGKVTLYGASGNAFVAGYVTVAKFSNPQGLNKAGGTLYTFNDAAGSMSGGNSFDRTNDVRQAGKSGAGSTQSGALELSNVDLADSFTDMIITQRAFEANTKVVTTADEMLQTLMSIRK
jgi:flagellar hook protein FlgE